MIFSHLLNMQSHPSWVCGLKPVPVYSKFCSLLSHPSWVCGLKQNSNDPDFAVQVSHPSWVCGLKLPRVFCKDAPVQVTPFVGVWIETQ